MRTTRRGLFLLGLGAAAFAAGCAPQEPATPLEPTAGTEKVVLVAKGMH